MNLTKSSSLSYDHDDRNLMMLQESVAKRKLVTDASALARVPGMRAPSTHQELHDAENPDRVRNSRDQGTRDGFFAGAAFPAHAWRSRFSVKFVRIQAMPELIDSGHRVLGEHGAVSQSVGDYPPNSAC